MEKYGTWEDGPLPESDSVAICSPSQRERMLLHRERGQPPAPRRVPAEDLAAMRRGQLLPRPASKRTPTSPSTRGTGGRFPSRLAPAHGHRFAGSAQISRCRGGADGRPWEPSQRTLSQRPACSDSVLPGSARADGRGQSPAPAPGCCRVRGTQGCGTDICPFVHREKELQKQQPALMCQGHPAPVPFPQKVSESPGTGGSTPD